METWEDEIWDKVKELGGQKESLEELVKSLDQKLKDSGYSGGVETLKKSLLTLLEKKKS